MAYADAFGFAQVLLALLLFALGLPALMIATVEGRVRHLLHHYRQYGGVTWFMTLTVGSVLIIILMADGEQVMQPPTMPPHGTSPVERRRAGVAPTQRTNRNSWPGSPGLQRSLAWVGGIPAASAAKVFTTAIFVLFGVIWLRMFVTDVRDRLVNHVATRISAARRKRQKHVSDEDLENLLALGASGLAGHEKRIVLEWINRLAVQSISDRQNAGLDFAVIIHGVGRVVMDSERPGSDDDFLQAIGVLRNCQSALQARHLAATSGAAALIETVCSVAESAMPQCSDLVAMACLDVAPDSRQVPFRIGAAALTHRRYRIAVAALSRLETLAAESDGVHRELLGLVALFDSGGGTAAAIGSSIVKDRLGYGIDALRAAAAKAAGEFGEIGEFALADLITAYAAAYR
jgi:hypothetical protein